MVRNLAPSCQVVSKIEKLIKATSMNENNLNTKKILVQTLSDQLIRLANLHYIADMKAYIVLGILGFIVSKMGSIIGNLYKNNIISNPCCLLLIILSIILVIIILYNIISTLIPRTSSIKENDLYIKSVAIKEFTALYDSYLQKNIDDLLHDITCEYKSNCVIAMEKFKYSRNAIIYLIFLFIIVGILGFITFL